MSDNDYVRFDEREDVICSIQHAAEMAAAVWERPTQWKWLVISLHSAVQGAMVCVLTGSAGIGALDESTRTKMAHWFEFTRKDPGAPKPRERLAPLSALLEFIQSDQRMAEFGGEPVVLSEVESLALNSLDELRHQFVHFKPMGWSIEVAWLTNIARQTLGVAKQLLQHPAIDFRISADQRERLAVAMKALLESLDH